MAVNAQEHLPLGEPPFTMYFTFGVGRPLASRYVKCIGDSYQECRDAVFAGFGTFSFCYSEREFDGQAAKYHLWQLCELRKASNGEFYSGTYGPEGFRPYDAQLLSQGPMLYPAGDQLDPASSVAIVDSSGVWHDVIQVTEGDA